MLTARRTKVALAAAVLIVGTGAAILFRREEAAQSTTQAGVNPPAIAAEPATDADARRGAVEPKLAGRIEPYPGLYSQPAPPNSGSTAAESKEKPESVAARSANDQVRAAAAGKGDLFARFASNSPAPRDPNKRHKIIDGDTLTALARRYLGAEERHLDLFEYNRDVLSAPELLPLGKELRIPPPDFVRPAKLPIESPSRGLTAVAQPVAAPPHTASAAVAASPPRPTTADADTRVQTYVVQAHDTLALIARKVYGDIGRQAELMAANRTQLRTPQDLRAGMTLVVPFTPAAARASSTESSCRPAACE